MDFIIYTTERNDVDGLDLSGFFDGWMNKPNDNVLLKSIKNADHAILAVDPRARKLVGYATAITDRVLAAYIPFLEVRAGYRGEGIGRAMVEKLLKELDQFYMIDITCDPKLAGFYVEAGFTSWHAMIKRNYSKQLGSTGAS